MRVSAEEFAQLELRAHSLLAEVPLHDAWAVDLEGGARELTVLELRELLSMDKLMAANPAVRLLFGLRRWLGRLFRWDRARAIPPKQSFQSRLSKADLEKSLLPPGTLDGPFRLLLASSHETISEVVNPTVHAFSVVALAERAAGYRLYLGIYVLPVGRITGWYMRLIDPFRRLIIYPAMLRQIRTSWSAAAT